MIQKTDYDGPDNIHVSRSYLTKPVLLPLLMFQFVNEESLAYELAGYFYLEIGETEQSKRHLLHAHEKYQVWVSWWLKLFSLLCRSGLGKIKSLLTLVVVFFSPKGAFEKSNSLIEFIQSMPSA